MLYDDYRDYVIKYKKEFGDNVIVLYECGSFFEIYDDGSGLVNMKEISELLNIIVSRRNKAIIDVSRNNFEMAGFPSHSLKKFINILLANNYTIVLVTQTTPPPNPKREVTDILSPGTILDVNNADSNNLMVIYLEESEQFKIDGINISIGCSIIDISTGKSYVYETSSYSKDICYPFDELHRIISIYTPKEIEVTSLSGTSITLGRLKENIDFGNSYIHDKLGDLDEKTLKPSYQEALLGKIYKKCGILSPIEHISLERKPLALVSYVRLLQFTFLHNEKILEDIQVPKILDENNTLLLSYNACHQLDILPNSSSDRARTNKSSCLLNILNNCKTSIGRRYFKQRLLNPYVDIADITKYHDIIDNISVEDMTSIRQGLIKVYDIERLYRKCIISIINPHELYNMFTSIENIERVHSLLSQSIPLNYQYDKIVEYTKDKLHIDRLIIYNIDNLDGDLFIKGYDKDVDDLQSKVNDSVNILNDLLLIFNNTHSNQQVTSSKVDFKLECNDKEGYYISTTSKRWNDYWKTNENIYFKGTSYKQKDFHVKTLTTCVKITNKYIDSINNIIISSKSKLSKLSLALFKKYIKGLCDGFTQYIDSIVDVTKVIDFITTCCYNNLEFKLTKPIFIPNSESYIKAEGVRHLIIEQNQTNIKYVANDVTLGDDDCKGILLYGINSAGKSSLMKSIGLTVIMAQSGMYVPCESLEISPYENVFTRISSNDDILRGHSTFTKEIIELRNILRRSSSKSLVIGDELCSGTESISALSIVSAGIITLSDKRSSFVFATHLHDLVNIEEVKNLKSLKIYHLSVKYDDATKKLVYDRHLKEGNGSTLYGIEVCKSLDLDIKFLELANKIRLKVMGQEKDIINGKKSRYNSEVYFDKCHICNENATEIHHIEEQNLSDTSGYINSYHKNSKFNLVGLCEKCHNDVHNSKLKIEGYVQTSEGKELIISKEDNNKYTDIIDNDVLNFIELTKTRTKKELYDLVCSKFNISKYRIQKILRNK